MLDHEQAQESFPRRGVAPMDGGQTVTPGQVGAYLLVEHVVVEQAVEVDQHRIGLVGQFRDAGKDIFRRIAVDEHGAGSSWPMPSSGSATFYHLPPTTSPFNSGVVPAISHHKIVLVDSNRHLRPYMISLRHEAQGVRATTGCQLSHRLALVEGGE